MASGDKVSTGKSNINKIKDGVGDGPKMGVSEVDPTSQSPKKVSGIQDFMSDTELKPNKVSGTKSF
jgi:hypothetical protein